MPTSSNRSAFSNLSTPSSRRACSGPSSTSLLPWAPRTEAETAPNMAEQLRILLVEDSLNDAELILRELTRERLRHEEQSRAASACAAARAARGRSAAGTQARRRGIA